MSYEYISLHLVFIQFHKKTCWKHDRKSCSTWLNLSEFDLIWLKTDLKKQAKLHAGVYILSWPKKKKSTAGPRSPPFPATGISWHAAPSLSQISPDSLPAAFNKTRLFLGSWPNFLLFPPAGPASKPANGNRRSYGTLQSGSSFSGPLDHSSAAAEFPQRPLKDLTCQPHK